MGSKNFPKITETITKNTSEDLTAYDVTNYTNIFIFAKWPGTGTGTLKLQNSPDGTEWKDVASSSQTISAAGNYYWDIITAAPFIRVVAAETGNVADVALEVWAIAKVA